MRFKSVIKLGVGIAVAALFGLILSCDNFTKSKPDKWEDGTYSLGDLRIGIREGYEGSRTIIINDNEEELILDGAGNRDVSELSAYYENLGDAITVINSDVVIDIDAMPRSFQYVLSTAKDFAKKMLSHKRWPSDLAPYRDLVSKIAQGRFKAYVDIMPSIFCSGNSVFFEDTKGLTARATLLMSTDYLMEKLYVVGDEYKLAHDRSLAVIVKDGKACIQYLDELTKQQREEKSEDMMWCVRYLATTKAGDLLPVDVGAAYEVIWQGLNSSDVETGSDIDSDTIWSLADPWILGMVSEEDIDISSFGEDFEPFSVNGVRVCIDNPPYNRALVFSTDSGILTVKPDERRASATFKLYEEQPGPPLISLGLAYNADFPSLNVRLPEDVDELLSIVNDIVSSVEASSANSWPSLDLNELVINLFNSVSERRIVVKDRQRGESFISDTGLEGRNVEVTLSMMSPPGDRLEIRIGSEGFEMYIENRDLLVSISKGTETAQSSTDSSILTLDSGAISDIRYMGQMLEIYRSEYDGTIDGGIEELSRFLENPTIPAVKLVEELPPPEWSWAAKLEKYTDS